MILSLKTRLYNFIIEFGLFNILNGFLIYIKKIFIKKFNIFVIINLNNIFIYTQNFN